MAAALVLRCRLAARRVRNPTRRDAKSELRKLVPGYAPTIHQLDLARQVDIERLRRASDSFDKLVRDVDRMTC
jgi:hypothetical protein